MKQLFEEYGDAIIQAIGGVGVLLCLISLLRSDGALRNLIVSILESVG